MGVSSGVRKKCECQCESEEKDRECRIIADLPALTLTLALFLYPERLKVATGICFILVVFNYPGNSIFVIDNNIIGFPL